MKRPPGYEMLKRAQHLRREMTPQEEVLWRNLRGRRFEGFKFRRQMWLAGYVADFACPAARLVVEADGSQHADAPEYDAARADAFTQLGWRTLRFWNNEIDNDLEAVLTAIRAALITPLPSREREGSARAARGRVRACERVADSPSPGQPAADHPLPCRERGL